MAGQPKQSEGIQWNLIMTGLLFVFLASVFTTVLPTALSKLKQSTGEVVVIPDITIEGIEEEKGERIDFLAETARLNIATIYSEDNPLATPAFVTNPDKLRGYLERNSVEINVQNDLSEAYLYIKTGAIDVKNESVYFFIVNRYSKQGHLVSSESLVSSSTSELLYDMTKLPLAQLPFPLEPKKKEINVVEEFLNKDLSYKDKKRQYFVGGFVSTTKLPNKIERMEIRYKCKLDTDCFIEVSR